MASRDSSAHCSTVLLRAVSLVPDDGKSYAVATIAGRQLRETSAVGGFPRPAQPIVLYEFEGERRTAASRSGLARQGPGANTPLPMPQLSAAAAAT